MSALELSANGMNAVSIVLAGRNSVHTWWTGIIGCLLFALVFFGAKLYADVTLQLFFVVTSALGWRAWLSGNAGAELPIGRTPPARFALMAAIAVVVAAAYAWVLHRFTDAASPLVDSLVLTISVLAQLLLMRRKFMSWPCWLCVNTLAVPLFWSRGLCLTSALYAFFWVNAAIAIVHWRRLMAAERT